MNGRYQRRKEFRDNESEEPVGQTGDGASGT